MSLPELLSLVVQHAPTLTPFVIAACFGVLQLQLRRFRPVVVRSLGLLEAVALKLGVTEAEAGAGEKKASSELPAGITFEDLMAALSTAAIERDKALAELAQLKAALPSLAAANGNGSPSGQPSLKPAH